MDLKIEDDMSLKKQTDYRGKSFSIPTLSKEGFSIFPNTNNNTLNNYDISNPIIQKLNTVWDLKNLETPRLPINIYKLNDNEINKIKSANLVRILDMPIKFPGSDEYKIPKELSDISNIIQYCADFEAKINPEYRDYYCYLTVDKGIITKGECLREAPCHVDGFQGIRWYPKHRVNHTYSVSDVLPTTFYIQPFDFSQLDDSKHDFFWEMNRQVANTNSVFAWQADVGAIVLMDGYTVHRGTESEIEQERTFIRISYETRIFDRLGNTHNPMYDYNWKMIKRDIEELKLVPFDPTCHPSLRVFPHQNLDGTPRISNENLGPLRKKQKTKPILRIEDCEDINLPWIPENEFINNEGWLYKEDLKKAIEFTKSMKK